MAPRKQQIDISETIFRPTPRLEHYRRAAGFMRAHRASLVAAGAGKRELATIDETIREFDWIIKMSDWGQPLDTPEPEPEPPREEQPLCPLGAEYAVAEIFAIALGDQP